MAEQTLLNAVRNERRVSRQGILQKLFAVWFDAFVYNQIWEDPRVDLQALELGPDSRVLAISSAGCNVLNYLLVSPAKITAVDLNRHHIALLDLKIAALRTLEKHEDFFMFFGHGKGPRTGELYHTFIAQALSGPQRAYWEKPSLFGSRRIDMFRDGGLYGHSRNARFLKFFRRLAYILGSRPEAVLAARSIDEQEELFAKYTEPFFNSTVIKIVGRLPVTMFGLGIPPQQFDELKKETNARGLVDLYRERVKRLACEFPIGENYFAWQAFAQKYDVDNLIALPDYLKKANYESLRTTAGKVESEVGPITSAIENRPAGSFDRFVLLDAQDWMNSDSISQLWAAIARKGAPGSRIIFRTAGSRSPLDTALPPALRQRFHCESALSRELYRRDRASIYGGFHLYTLK